MRKFLGLVVAAGWLHSAPVSAGNEGRVEPLGREISFCWDLDALSSEAAGATTIVEFQVDASGGLVSDSVALISSTAPDAASIEQAFQSARRAIIRCLATQTLESQYRETNFVASFSLEDGVSVSALFGVVTET
jgi:hypothetical protein